MCLFVFVVMFMMCVYVYVYVVHACVCICYSVFTPLSLLVQLRKMVEIHVRHGAVDEECGNVMDGALMFRDMQVKQVMTPASQVFMLSVAGRLDFEVRT